MAWFWPPSWFKKVRTEVVTPECGHRELACEFFWLPRLEQYKVLYFLGVSNREAPLVMASAEPFNDVKNLMSINREPEKKMTAELYLARLRAVYNDGRRCHVVATLQNIFRDKTEAEHYADLVAKWEG